MNKTGKLLSGWLFSFFVFCSGDKENQLIVDTSNKNSPAHGVIRVDIDNGGASVAGFISDGPSPGGDGFIWEVAAKSGNCSLLIPRIPVCGEPCGFGAQCVEDDSCRAYPDQIDIGMIKVTGIRGKSGETTLNLHMANGNYYSPPSTELPLASPPFAEGDVITVSAGGDSGVPAFSMNARGIRPINSLIDSVKMEDGKSITLQWTPPAVAGISSVSIIMELYPLTRPNTRGRIEGTGEDNGELVVDVALLKQLRALDSTAGFFYVTITRSSIGFDDAAQVELRVASTVEGFIPFPGVIPCLGRGNGACPDGMTCEGHMCR